jgi:hypothetical protein
VNLDEDAAALYRERFADGKSCPHCGGIHLRACPRVKRLVFRGQDQIAEVEFWGHGWWPEDEIIWPEDVFETGNDPASEESADGEEAG